MYVAIVEFPAIPAPRDDEFRAWFDWSNQALADADGLCDRRLLRSDDGRYLAIVEHDTSDTFAAMHQSQVASQVRDRLQTVLSGAPQARTYELVSQPLVSGGGCCGQEDGSGAEVATDRAAGTEQHGCCASEPATIG